MEQPAIGKDFWIMRVTVAQSGLAFAPLYLLFAPGRLAVGFCMENCQFCVAICLSLVAK